MPIKVDIVDNNSSVRVKPHSKNDIPVRPDDRTNNARLEALIEREKQERIAADEALQRQIDENKINFIPLDNYITEETPYIKEGILPEIILKYLKNNQLNKIVLGSKVYYLSIKDGNIQQYFSNTSSSISGEPNFNRVDLNIKTGEFIIKDTWLDEQVKLAQRHRVDTEVHIQPGERKKWNNKLNCEDEISEENWIINRN